MGKGARQFTDLRAWQACDLYKKAIYELCSQGPLERDWDRRRQLEKSVNGPPAHIAEGFGRFSPPDFARYTVLARSSLMESQNHLRDLVDRGYITESVRASLDAMAVVAIKEVTGLMEYLQAPEALRNARRSRERRLVTRDRREATRVLAQDAAPTTETPAETEIERERINKSNKR